MRKLLSIVLSLLLLVLPLTVSAAAPKQNGTIYIPKEIKGDTASCSFSYRKGENKLTLVGTGNLGGLYRYPFAVQQNTNRQNIALLSNGWTDVLWAMSTAVRTGKVQNIILSNGTRSFSRNGKNQVESCSSSGVDSHYRYDSRGRLTSVILDDRSRDMGGDCSQYYYGYQEETLDSFRFELYKYWGRSKLAFDSAERLLRNEYTTEKGYLHTDSNTYYNVNQGGKLSSVSTTIKDPSTGKGLSQATLTFTYNSHGYMTGVQKTGSNGKVTNFSVTWQRI